jgi:regulator of sirC expression with transglutaminase-like and TPR domain
LGDLGKALQDHTKAIELNPNLAEGYYNRGTAYRRLGDPEHAIHDYERYLQLAPDGPQQKEVRSLIKQLESELPATERSRGKFWRKVLKRG